MAIAPSPATTAVTGSDWQAEAACQNMNTELFYNPDAIRGHNKRSREASAKAICETCPVMATCLQYALSINEPYGVWGGKTPEERERILSMRLVAV